MLAVLVLGGLLLSGGAEGRRLSELKGRLPIRQLNKRDIDARSARIQARLEQIRQGFQTYEKNMANPDYVAYQNRVLQAAQELEQESKKRKRATGYGQDGSSVPMIDYWDGQVDDGYASNISIGTPGQTLTVVPDTGSADLWVPKAGINDPGHNLFDPTKSSTFKTTNYTFVDSYGLGEANGTIVNDVVTFGGYSLGIYWGLASSVDSQFVQQENDGILGMANSNLATDGIPTFFEDLISTKQINNPYFSTFLIRGLDVSTNINGGLISGSTLCLGCIAQPGGGQSLTGSMAYVPISPFAYYEVSMSGINLNGQAITGTQSQVIIDTGTTDIILPTTVANAMMAAVQGQEVSGGSYIVPASSLHENTVFSFTFSGNTYTVNVLDLIAGYADRNMNSFLMNVQASDIADPNGAPLGIMGDVFIKNVIAVFSYSTNGVPAMGLQQLVSNTSVSPTSVGQAGSTTRGPGVPTSAGTATTTRSFGVGGGGTTISASGAAGTSGTTKSGSIPRFDPSLGVIGAIATAVSALLAGTLLL